MAKKRVFWGMLAMALALSFAVMGCSDPLQEGGTVKLDYNKAPGVEKVTVKATTGAGAIKAVLVTWKAVDNVSSYAVYAQQSGKKTIENLGAGQYVNKYSDAGVESTNDDRDNHSLLARIGTIQSGKSYRFGVRTTSIDSFTTSIASDIVWSDYVTAP